VRQRTDAGTLILVESTLKIVRILRIVFLLSIPLYLEIVRTVPSQSVPQAVILYALSGLSFADTGAIFILRRILITRSEQALVADPNNVKAVARWRAGYIAVYGMGLSIAIYGLILHFLGFDFAHVLPFFGAGFVLLLCFPPRVPTQAF